jgi:hypothetical protein
MRTYLENTQHKKRAGGVALVEHLLSKHEALSSNSCIVPLHSPKNAEAGIQDIQDKT